MGLSKDGAEGRKEIAKAFASTLLPLKQLYAIMILYRKPGDPKVVWDSELHRFITYFRLRHHSFQPELQSDDEVVSYTLEEVNQFLKTVNMSSNMTVQKLGLCISHRDIPPLRVLEKEQEHLKKMKKMYLLFSED